MEKEIFDYLGKAIFWFGVIFIGVLIFMFTPLFTSLDFSKSGPFGDTLSGLSAILIGSLGVTFTFLAFYVQFQANQSQREQFLTQLREQKAESDKQELIARIDRFEMRFFELIRLHKENVNEINIKNGAIQGRKSFVLLFQEFRFSYCILKHFILKEALNDWFPNDSGFIKDDEETITNIAFLIFFIGTGKNSDPLLFSYTKDICTSFFLEKALVPYKKMQKEYFTKIKSQAAIAQHPIADKIADKRKKHPKLKILNDEIGELEYTARYKPFSGHIANLGHYYRHLFQTVKFVDQLTYLDPDDKIKYIKNLRAQLSSHEQLLLYYNSLSKFGQAWNDPKNNFIVKYRMIKNIPLPLAGFGIKPENKYKTDIAGLKANGDELFEWYE